MSVKPRRHYDIERDIRGKIEVIKLINRLQNHALGQCEMTQTQIRAAEVCLKKAIPDLTYSESKSEVVHRFAEVPKTADQEEWDRILASRSGVLNQAPRPS